MYMRMVILPINYCFLQSVFQCTIYVCGYFKQKKTKSTLKDIEFIKRTIEFNSSALNRKTYF